MLTEAGEVLSSGWNRWGQLGAPPLAAPACLTSHSTSHLTSVSCTWQVGWDRWGQLGAPSLAAPACLTSHLTRHLTSASCT